jgi:hypothetical protein
MRINFTVTVPLPFLGLITHRYLTVILPLQTVMTVTDRYRYSLLLTVFWKFDIIFIAFLKVAGF